MVTEDGEVVNAIPQVFLRTPFNYDRDAVSRETGLGNFGESLADQSQEEEANINTIVKRFGLTGQLPHNVKVPTYADLTEVPDFVTAMDMVRRAREAFMEMPADVRYRFGNDAGAFADFCSNPANQDELIKMGVATKIEPVVESVQKVEVVNPPSAVPAAK